MTISPLQQLAAQEVLKRKRAATSLVAFREYLAPTGYPDFEHPPAEHHLVMIRELERLERGEIQRLLILAPPGSAKSTYNSIQYPLWRLANKPNENILCASNTQTLAEDFNRRRRAVALSPEWVTLAQTKLSEDLQSVSHFGTEKQGGIRAAGVGTSIVGFRSKLNVLDDPIRGIEEALSASTLDKHWDWFHQEFRTRLVPGGKELIVSTRWAKRDIPGRILALIAAGEEEWTVLRLPMLADRDDDPLGRAIDEPLWPEWFNSAHIEAKQKHPFMFSTQFQQTPLDETGSWVDTRQLVFEDRPVCDLNYVIAMDLALSVGKGDFTVFVVAGIDADRRVHIVHVERGRVGPEETVANLFELCRVYKPTEVLIDDDNSSKVFTRLLFELSRTGNQPPPPLSPQPIRGRDKETRASAIRGAFLSDSVRIARANWNAALMRECLEFPSGDHDDIIDCLSLIGRRLPVLSNPAKDPHGIDVDPFEGCALRDDGDGMKLNIPLETLFRDHEDSRPRRTRI